MSKNSNTPGNAFSCSECLQLSDNCGLFSSADWILFFLQKLRIIFECGLFSSAGYFRVNWVVNFEIHTYVITYEKSTVVAWIKTKNHEKTVSKDIRIKVEKLKI